MKTNLKQKDVQVLLNNFNAKKYDFVILKANIYLKKSPGEAILRNLLGLSYQSIAEYSKAKDVFIEGLKYDPKNISLKNNLAKSYNSLFQYDKAEKLYNEIIKVNPNYPIAYLNLGNQKRDLNQLTEAVKLYEIADKLSPNNDLILYALALAHRGLGNFENAVQYAKKVISINPKFTRADLLISRCITYDEKNWHYKDLIKRTEDKELTKDEDIELCFSLSKAKEDMNKINDAYKFLKIGNDLRKKKSKYDIKSDLDLIEDIKQLFKNINFEKFSYNTKDKIIFVLGMPRSGTSLVEQIISSHSSVFGGGELPYMDMLIKKNFITTKKTRVKDAQEVLSEQSKVNFIANEYLNYIKNLNTKNKYFLDKSLLNFMWIGFIKILFPNSKIIHCYRDPKNNCLSIYKNLFRDGLGFAHNEEDLIKFYKAYHDLMNFWKSKNMTNLIDVNYEELIKDSENGIKKIIKHCELDWEENCLSFYKNKNPIKTISAAQARKPIYKSSLNAFDQYKDYLKVIDKSF